MKHILLATALAAALGACADRSISVGGKPGDPYAAETNAVGTRDAARGIVDRPWRSRSRDGGPLHQN